jgi:hypothetical protein
MDNTQKDTSRTDTRNDAAWSRIARSQGLVCIVCKEPPAAQRRAEFYDSGLCRACAADIGIERTAAGR